MTNAIKDNNQINVILGVLNTNGITPTPPKANPTTHVLQTMDGTTGSDAGHNAAYRDDNQVVNLMAASESDGITPINLYVDSDGYLLTDEN